MGQPQLCALCAATDRGPMAQATRQAAARGQGISDATTAACHLCMSTSLSMQNRARMSAELKKDAPEADDVKEMLADRGTQAHLRDLRREWSRSGNWRAQGGSWWCWVLFMNEAKVLMDVATSARRLLRRQH